MAELYILETANLFCGDDDPSNSKHLILDSMKLPQLEEATQEHRPGGSQFALNIALGKNPLMATFKMVGYDPATLKLFGLGTGKPKRFTALGAVRSKRTGDILEAKVIMEGRLIHVEPDEFKRGDLMGHDHSIDEVTHYELWFNNEEIYYFDFWTAVWRVNGVDESADERRILRIPGS